MKENKFKPGDRIAVYWPDISKSAYRETGTVISIQGDELRIDGDNTDSSPRAKISQCKKLIPKKKKRGDEIWVNHEQQRYVDWMDDLSLECALPDGSIKSPIGGYWIKYKRCK